MEYATNQTTLLFLNFLLNPLHHDLDIIAGSYLVLILSTQLTFSTLTLWPWSWTFTV